MLDRFIAILLLAGLIPAQEPGVEKKEPSQMPVQKPARVAEHDLLGRLAGRWDITVKRTDPAGGPPLTSSESGDAQVVCNGLWLLTHRTNPDAGTEWHSILGYDANKKRYVGVRVSSQGYDASTVEGDFDAKSNTLTLRGDFPNAEGKKQPIRVTCVLRDDERQDTVYGTGKDGKEAVLAEITYRRAKLPAKPAEASAKVNLEKRQTPPAPLAEHRKLDAFVGSWEGTVTATAEGSTTPMEGKATETSSTICNGLFCWTEVKGEYMKKPFEGYGLIAYDPDQKTYTSFWVDNLGSSLSVASGTPDKDGKVWTMTGSCAAPNGKPARTSETTRFTDANTRTWTCTMLDESGKPVMKMEGTAKRQK